MEREPTVVLEPRPDSPCPPLAHSPSHAQALRTEVSMETTLSGRSKDYSFVTDGEKRDRMPHRCTKDTHTHACAQSPVVTVSHLTATLWLLSESSGTDVAAVPQRLRELKPASSS